jgi:hypothetical protein
MENAKYWKIFLEDTLRYDSGTSLPPAHLTHIHPS